MTEFVKSVLSDIEELGFKNIFFYEYNDGGFRLRIQVSYEGEKYTYNIEIHSWKPVIMYGYGSNGISGEEIPFDYKWNKVAIINAIKSALRTTVAEALKEKEKRKLNSGIL